MHTYISWVESLLELINTTFSFYGSIVYTIIQNIAFINIRMFFLKIRIKDIIFHYSWSISCLSWETRPQGWVPPLHSQSSRLCDNLKLSFDLLFWDILIVTFLHIHDSDSIGAKVLVFPCAAMVLHLYNSYHASVFSVMLFITFKSRIATSGTFTLNTNPSFHVGLKPLLRTAAVSLWLSASWKSSGCPLILT